MTTFYLDGEARTVPAKPGFDAYFDAAHTAVISIDMHEGHLSESPDCPCPSPRGREIVAPIDDFHDLARAAGVQVIHVRSELRKSGRDDVRGIPSTWRLLMEESIGVVPNIDEHAIVGSQWTEFRTRVEPDDEIVNSKKRLSAFYPTDLDFLLRQMGITTVVIEGIMTDCCVLNSAFDAANRNYRVIVPRDLTRGTNEEMEDFALRAIGFHLGLVVDSVDLVAAWHERSTPAASA